MENIDTKKQNEATQAILKAVEAIRKDGLKLQDKIQETALEILVHIEAYGQESVGLANALVGAVHGMGRANALKQWFMKYGKMSYSMKKKTLVFRADFKTDIKAATAMKFWDLVKEEEFKPFDLEKAVIALVKKAERIQGEGDDRNKIDPELYAKLQKLA